MIIANRLTDGRVVFRASAGIWVQDIADGKLAENADEGEALLRAAKVDEANCLVVEPTLIEVEVIEGRRKPVAIREAIRAFGPSPVARTDRLEA